MRAVVRDAYGSPDLLRLEEIDRPTPGDDDVLIRVRAVSLNLSDWEFMTGKPLYARLYGFLKPKFRILGTDIAGVVEAVGARVRGLEVGDGVYGDIMGYEGGLAEYTCVPEDVVQIKPASLTFEEAAAIPQAGTIALQGIRDAGRAAPGRKLLINGAGGGSGMFGIQLAKALGAEITGVDHAGKLDFMRSIGADDVVDYTSEDFTKRGKKYDFILDLAARRSIFDHISALSPGGMYRMVGGTMRCMLSLLFLGPFLSLFSGKRMGILGVNGQKDDLRDLQQFFESGKVKPVIHKTFALEEVAQAIRFVGEGRGLGKIVVTI